jgi:hypothetical protein
MKTSHVAWTSFKEAKGKVNCNFWSKNTNLWEAVYFSQFLVINIVDLDPDPHWQKMLDPDPTYLYPLVPTFPSYPPEPWNGNESYVLSDGFPTVLEPWRSKSSWNGNESYILLYDCNNLGTSVGSPVRMVMLLDVKEYEFMERKWIIYHAIGRAI